MATILANIVVMLMSATFVLLAVQAEPFTATLGYLFAGVLFLAVVRQTTQARNNDARKSETGHD